ncbi:MAG: methylase [Thaumarchaeota archaeon]|nr:methylase [Nitrososphaerota archaeon]
MQQELIAIPSTVLEDCSTLRERTEKAGMIARAAAIFGISKICIYGVDAKRDEDRFLKLILEYLETPQYLRKKIYPISEELKFAGLLPPLRIPSHLVPADISKVKVGDVREGIVVKQDKRHFADIGLPKLAAISDNLPSNKRITAQITSMNNGISARIIDREDAPAYWGYTVATFPSMTKMFQQLRPDFSVLTSRKGTSIQDKWDSIGEKIRLANSLLVAFGSPKRGLPEILAQEKLQVQNSILLNTIPKQTVETVRAEEAMLATLAVLNLAKI